MRYFVFYVYWNAVLHFECSLVLHLLEFLRRLFREIILPHVSLASIRSLKFPECSAAATVLCSRLCLDLFSCPFIDSYFVQLTFHSSATTTTVVRALSERRCFYSGDEWIAAY